MSYQYTKSKILWFLIVFFYLTGYSFSATRYVSYITNNPVSPYLTPSTAATNINDALQQALSGDVIKIIDSYRSYQGFSVMSWTAACNQWWAEPNNITIEADPQYNPAVNSAGCYNNAIFMGKITNIIIKNIDVINISTGNPSVRIEQNSYNCKLINCTISNGNNVGIKLDAINHIIVSNCRIINNSVQGIYFGNSCHSNFIVGDTFIYRNGNNGIELSGWGDHCNNEIKDSTISSNSGTGIYINASSVSKGNIIKNCKIQSNTIVGIKLDKANNNIIENCNIKYNSEVGIYFGNSSTNNKILKSEIAYNGSLVGWHDGIRISEWGNNVNNLIQECSIYSNASRGIMIATGAFGTPKDNIIFKCLIYRNGNDGVNIYNDSSGNRIEYCTLFDNGNNGVALDSDDTLKNCIIVSNDANGVFGNNNPTVSYCCAYGNSTANWNNCNPLNCISDNPRFKSMTPGSENFYLKWNSPCQNVAEPNNGQQACMGRYTACVVPDNTYATNAATHNIIWASSLSNNLYQANDKVVIYYKKANGGSSDFKFSNVTIATSATSWGTNFSSESGNTANQYIEATVDNSISTLGKAENIAFSIITNANISTNYVIIQVTNTTSSEVDGPVIANDFRIYTLGNTPVHYVSFITNNPAFPYDTPSTAAVDIQTVIDCSALDIGDEIIIIDNYRQYDGFTMNSGKPDNITLYAGKGFSPAISNSQQTFNHGIYIDGPDNIVISNLNIIENGGDGIALKDSANSRIVSNQIFYNDQSGISFDNCQNAVISGNEIWSNGDVASYSYKSDYAGIYFWDNTVAGSVINNNNVHHNPVNIKILEGPISFTVTNNLCHNSQNSNGFNILIAGGKKNILKNNQCYEAWFTGRNIKFVWSNSNIIYNNIMRDADSGIRFESALYNIVSHNTITNNGLGMFLYKGQEAWAPYSTNNFIFTNRIIGGSYGIYIERGPKTVIQSNIISGCEIGIYAGTTFPHGADNTVVKLNTIKNCQKSGILIYYGNSSVIENNTIINNGKDDNTAGIRFYFHNNDCIMRDNVVSFNSNNGIVVKGTNNQIINNEVYNNINRGIRLNSFSLSNTISSNTVYNHNYGIILEEGCYCNTLITNILYNNSTIGLFLTSGAEAANTNKIVSCQIHDNNLGVHLNGVVNNILTNCSIYNNSGIGVKLDNADINKIKNCDINDNSWEGVYLGNSCTNNLINNCLIRGNNSEGIELSFWGNHFKNSIQYCTVVSNKQYGIHIEGNFCSNFISFSEISSNKWEGIFIYRSDCNTIYSNKIKNNGIEGILIKSNSINNIIKKNTISYNTNGIRLENNVSYNIIVSNEIFKNDCEGICVIQSSCYNQIYHNNISSNIYQGIRIISNADKNIIENNIIWSNGEGVKLEFDSDTNSVLSNQIFYNRWKGVYVVNSSNNEIIGNNVYRNGDSGIRISGGACNKIVGNLSLTNSSDSGLMLDSGTLNNYCSSNIFAYNNNGIEINNSTSCTLFRNAIYHNSQHGILLDNNAINNAMINNSLSSNSQVAGDGIHLSVGLSGNIIKNSIIAFTKSGFGINDNTGGGSAVITYCDVFDNSSGGYGGAASPSTGCIVSDPLWISYNIYSSNFLYLQDISPCVDAGDPLDTPPVNGGPAIDMGWKEYTRPYVNINITKSITNVTLGGGNRILIPGTTVEYKLDYRINGNKNASNVIIYDRVPHYSVYCTNNTNTAGGWTVEYSTNDNPDQGYISSEYQKTYTDKGKVKWVRWKKPVETNTSNFFLFSIIIK